MNLSIVQDVYRAPDQAKSPNSSKKSPNSEFVHSKDLRAPWGRNLEKKKHGQNAFPSKSHGNVVFQMKTDNEIHCPRSVGNDEPPPFDMSRKDLKRHTLHPCVELWNRSKMF